MQFKNLKKEAQREIASIKQKYDKLIKKSQSELKLLMDEKERENQDRKVIFCRACYKRDDASLKKCTACSSAMCDYCIDTCEGEECDVAYCKKCEGNFKKMKCGTLLCDGRGSNDCSYYHVKHCECPKSYW